MSSTSQGMSRVLGWCIQWPDQGLMDGAGTWNPFTLPWASLLLLQSCYLQHPVSGMELGDKILLFGLRWNFKALTSVAGDESLDSGARMKSFSFVPNKQSSSSGCKCGLNPLEKCFAFPGMYTENLRLTFQIVQGRLHQNFREFCFSFSV